MDWKTYTLALLIFSAVSFLVVFLLQRLQGILLLNPQKFGATTPDLAFNTAISFVTNTNWQNYGGETTLSYLTQMVGLTVQNFVSAAAGMAVLVAVIRYLARKQTMKLGNFWVDLTTAYFISCCRCRSFLPCYWSAGVVQTFSPYKQATLLLAHQLPAT